MTRAEAAAQTPAELGKLVSIQGQVAQPRPGNTLSAESSAGPTATAGPAPGLGSLPPPGPHLESDGLPREGFHEDLHLGGDSTCGGGEGRDRLHPGTQGGEGR